MKVKIKSHSPVTPIPWWYENFVGETFQVDEDRKHKVYYIVGPTEDYPHGRHILKIDCEIVEV